MLPSGKGLHTRPMNNLGLTKGLPNFLGVCLHSALLFPWVPAFAGPALQFHGTAVTRSTFLSQFLPSRAPPETMGTAARHEAITFSLGSATRTAVTHTDCSHEQAVPYTCTWGCPLLRPSGTQQPPGSPGAQYGGNQGALGNLMVSWILSLCLMPAHYSA